MSSFFSSLGSKIATSLLVVWTSVSNLYLPVPQNKTPLEQPVTLPEISTPTPLMPLPREVTYKPLPTETATSTEEEPEVIPQPIPPIPELTLPSIPETPFITNFPSITNDSKLKSAIVNILCTSKVKEIGSISASGVLIDSRGVVLTNAHVGQFFLLTNLAKKGYVNCVVKTGNPATKSFNATLLYISKDWINKNYKNLTSDVSRGTGENDFALLLITNETNSKENLASFPFLSFDPIKIKKDKDIIVAGYPAEFLPSSTINKNLYSLSATSRVEKVFTFRENTVDLISTKGGVVAQRGSSGGAIVDDELSLIAIITTASSKFNSERNLYAITSLYINQVLKTATGEDMASFLEGDLNDKASSAFLKKSAPILEAKLMSNFK